MLPFSNQPPHWTSPALKHESGYFVFAKPLQRVLLTKYQIFATKADVKDLLDHFGATTQHTTISKRAGRGRFIPFQTPQNTPHPQ